MSKLANLTSSVMSGRTYPHRNDATRNIPKEGEIISFRVKICHFLPIAARTIWCSKCQTTVLQNRKRDRVTFDSVIASVWYRHKIV